MKRSFLFSFIITFFLFACGGNKSSDMMAVQKTESAEPYYDNASTTESVVVEDEISNNASPTTSTKVEQKLIKTGNISFEVEDVNKTQNELTILAKKYNAYISNENSNNYSYRINHSVTIRIPNQHFDHLLSDIAKGVEHFDKKEINVQDVTEEFLDTQSRIENKKKLEARYNELLNKATTIAEILEIEKEINNLRTEIERLEGRLKYLKNQVNYSTLNITYYKNINQPTHGVSNKFSQGFVNGWNGLVMFFIGLINIWPFLIILGGLIFWIRKIIQKRRAKKAE